MRGFALMVAVLGLCACGKPSLEASCRRGLSVTCKRLFECARSTAEALYGSESNCVTQFNSTCDSYRNYECDDLSAYERCINDYATVSCASISTAGCTGSVSAGCRLAGGRTVCGTTNMNSTGGGCTVTLSQCGDGRVYTLACSGSSCTCSDGSNMRSVFGTCSDGASAIATCGWNVQP